MIVLGGYIYGTWLLLVWVIVEQPVLMAVTIAVMMAMVMVVPCRFGNHQDQDTSSQYKFLVVMIVMDRMTLTTPPFQSMMVLVIMVILYDKREICLVGPSKSG